MKIVTTLTLLLFAATLSPAQLSDAHLTGTTDTYAIPDTPVGQWSAWNPFVIANLSPNPIRLKRIYALGIKTCTYDSGGQHCDATQHFQINTGCGDAQGGKFLLPAILQPGNGCTTLFYWQPVHQGPKKWLLTIEAVDLVTGADVSVVEFTQGNGQ